MTHGSRQRQIKGESDWSPPEFPFSVEGRLVRDSGARYRPTFGKSPVDCFWDVAGLPWLLKPFWMSTEQDFGHNANIPFFGCKRSQGRTSGGDSANLQTWRQAHRDGIFRCRTTTSP